METLKQLVSQGASEGVEKCSQEFLKLSPNSIELQEFYLRSLLWQKKYDVFKKAVGKIKSNKEVYYRMLGDYYWYRENYKSCSRVYRYLNKYDGGDSKKNLYRFILCSYESDGTKELSSYKQLVSSFPNSVEVLNIKSLFDDSNRNLLDLNYFKYQNSDGNNLAEANINGLFYWKKVHHLQLGLKNIEREFGEKEIKDQIISANYRRDIERYGFEIGAEHTISPEFTYKNAYHLGLDYKFLKELTIGVDGEFREYSDKTISIFNLSLEYYFGDWLLDLSLPLDMESRVLKLSYFGVESLAISGWYSSGEDESSRPYLSGSTDSNYEVLGLKLHLKKKIQPYLIYERRNEESFEYDMFGVGLQFEF
ncbi:hypothetical protein [Bacteriovorax sp. DB6_IX]|uniref:hypothetical protein n=1 Tax=Bacteriovorax sp. DB6_IX TaxID=1353530 RepID=UPI0012F74D9D|nr:hypothetical protein [Bacteriovorax sp. DB6_IX]